MIRQILVIFFLLNLYFAGGMLYYALTEHKYVYEKPKREVKQP
jgi:hypothetical protein